jgi:hypothetical protein
VSAADLRCREGCKLFFAKPLKEIRIFHLMNLHRKPANVGIVPVVTIQNPTLPATAK